MYGPCSCAGACDLRAIMNSHGKYEWKNCMENASIIMMCVLVFVCVSNPFWEIEGACDRKSENESSGCAAVVHSTHPHFYSPYEIVGLLVFDSLKLAQSNQWKDQKSNKYNVHGFMWDVIKNGFMFFYCVPVCVCWIVPHIILQQPQQWPACVCVRVCVYLLIKTHSNEMKNVERRLWFHSKIFSRRKKIHDYIKTWETRSRV